MGLACQHFRDSIVKYTCYLVLGWHWPNSGPFLLLEIWVIVCDSAMAGTESSTYKEERKNGEKGEKERVVTERWQEC